MSARICHASKHWNDGNGNRTYTLLEGGNLLIGKRISLGNNRDEIDFGVKSAHDLDIQRLERVASRLNEVNAGVHAVVDNVHAVDLVLGVEVSIKSLLDVLDNGSPRVIVINEVTKARGINHGQTETDAILFNVGADGLYANGLGSKVKRRLLALLGRV